MILDELFRSVRTTILYYPLREQGWGYSLFYRDIMGIDPSELLYRSKPNDHVTILLYFDQEKLETVKELLPVPGGEKPKQYLHLVNAHQYINGIEVVFDLEFLNKKILTDNGFMSSSRYDLVYELVSKYCHKFNIPLHISKKSQEELKKMMPIIHSHLKKEVDREQQEKYKPNHTNIQTYENPENALERFANFTEQEQRQFLNNIGSMASWFEGWQMEEDDNKSFATVMYLLKKVLDTTYLDKIEYIYRSTLTKNIPNRNKRLVLTSPKRFQSWTTKYEVAKNIAKSNYQTLAYGAAHQAKIVVFKAKLSELDVVCSVRDLDHFLEELYYNFDTYVHGKVAMEPRIRENVSTVSTAISKFDWQDEIIIKSPVNRKIPIVNYRIIKY